MWQCLHLWIVIIITALLRLARNKTRTRGQQLRQYKYKLLLFIWDTVTTHFIVQLSRSRVWEVFGLVKDRLPVFSNTSDISSLTFDNLAGGRQRQSLVSSSVRSSSQNQSDWQVRVDVLTQQSVPPLLPSLHVVTSSRHDGNILSG